MTITPVTNHGKPRWRVNVQRGDYRKRMFFETCEEAVAFAQASGGPVNFGAPTPAPSPPPPPARPVAAPRIQNPRPAASIPKTPKPPGLRNWISGEGWESER